MVTIVRMSLFNDDAVPMSHLRERAFNLRWATVADDVIPLTAADMDFQCAPPIREAMIDYAKSGVFSYGPAEGLPEFRSACARMLRTRKATPAEAQHCLAVNSAAKGLSLVAETVLSPGDEVLIFDPVDFLFARTIQDAGAIPVRVAANAEAMRTSITPKTKMIALCNPWNPRGIALSRQELEAIGAVAEDHNLWILSDEIWSDIVFAPAQHVATASLSPAIAKRTFTVHGLSKTFGLSGLRVGFVHIANDEAFAQLRKTSRVESTVEGTATMSQVAAIAAYEHGWPWVTKYLQHLSAMRDLAVSRLCEVEGVRVEPPDGCSVLFPNVEQWGDENELQKRLLETFRVAVVPGGQQWFGPGGAGHLRLSFATSEGILTEGLDRLTRGLEALR